MYSSDLGFGGDHFYKLLLSAFLRNFFLCLDRPSGDVPPTFAMLCSSRAGSDLWQYIGPKQLFIRIWQQVHKKRNRFEITLLVAVLGTKFPKEHFLVHKTTKLCATQNTDPTHLKLIFLLSIK